MGIFGKSKKELLEWQNIIAPNTPRLMWNEKQLKVFTQRSVEESLKVIQESMNHCNTTKKPEVFFKRYDILEQQLEVLSKLEKFVRFNGDKPSSKLSEIRRIKQSEVSKMIERAWEDTLDKSSKLKTEKGKINKINAFRDEMDKYSNFMDDSNIDKYEALCEQYLS